MLVAVACGGSDFIDPPDETVDGSAVDGSTADGPSSRDGSSNRDVNTTPPRDSAVDADLRDAAKDGEGGATDLDAGGSDADAAIPDADAGVDAAVIDAGGPDADAAIPDAAIPDAAIPDAAIPDAAIPDAAILDAAPDATAASNVPDLRSAKSFAILAGQTVTNSGALTTIFGDLGVSPGSTVVGLPPGQPTGTIHLGNDGVAVQAQLDLTTLYDDLAGRPCPASNVLTGQDLAGKTLAPGVYCFASSAALGVGQLTLDANNDPNAFWVFQVASTLVVAASTVTVINGPPALACNAFWQVGSSATLLDNASFAGNIVALSSISLNTGAVITPGRALARNAATTLLSNQISKAACP